MWDWLENHLFSCPFKTLTNWDCPGCGFQRSLIALFNGNIYDSLYLYPATVPILILFLGSILKTRLNPDKTELVIKPMLILSGAMVMISYLCKLAGFNIITILT